MHHDTNSTSGPPPTPSDRLNRIEENLSFTDKAVEDLSAEIADLNRRMQQLTKRLLALEERLTKANESDEPDNH